MTKPSCTENGYTTYVCRCGNSYTADETAALGHVEEALPNVAPGCENAGFAGGTKCNRCGSMLNVPEEIPALGHQYRNGACIRCGIADPNRIPGDANGDNKLDYSGALLILRASIGLETLSEETVLICDLNGNGKLEYSDALIILRRSIGLE